MEKEKPAIAIENQTFYFEELSLINNIYSRLSYE